VRNPFNIRKRNKDLDIRQLERSIDRLYDVADDTKLQKSRHSMQDTSSVDGKVSPPIDVTVTSGISREDTLFRMSYLRATWSKVPGAFRYTAQMSTKAMGQMNAMREGSAAEAQWENVPPGAQVQVRVRSTDDRGNNGEWSAWVTHVIDSGVFQGVAPVGLDVTKFGKWIHASVDRVPRRSNRDHFGFEWHASTTEALSALTHTQRLRVGPETLAVCCMWTRQGNTCIRP